MRVDFTEASKHPGYVFFQEFIQRTPTTLPFEEIYPNLEKLWEAFILGWSTSPKHVSYPVVQNTSSPLHGLRCLVSEQPGIIGDIITGEGHRVQFVVLFSNGQCRAYDITQVTILEQPTRTPR